MEARGRSDCPPLELDTKHQILRVTGTRAASLSSLRSSGCKYARGIPLPRTSTITFVRLSESSVEMIVVDGESPSPERRTKGYLVVSKNTLGC